MRIVAGMSGASGAMIGIRLLEALREHPEQVIDLAKVTHDIRDVGASIASGSFKAAGMVVAPCSMKTLAGIVSGYSDNLLLRAADVTIKERRPLILIARETPLSGIHLENMRKAHQNGCTILPPVPAFYNRPQTVDDVVDHIVGVEANMVTLSDGTGALRVDVQAQWVGPDLVVTIGGGTRAHVGAVAIAQPRPSLKGDGQVSSTASVITLLGHKEDELARWAALLLAAQLNTNVVVTAGLHIDEATLDQIVQLDGTARALVKALAERLAQEPQPVRGAGHA